MAYLVNALPARSLAAAFFARRRHWLLLLVRPSRAAAGAEALHVWVGLGTVGVSRCSRRGPFWFRFFREADSASLLAPLMTCADVHKQLQRQSEPTVGVMCLPDRSLWAAVRGKRAERKVWGEGRGIESEGGGRP